MQQSKTYKTLNDIMKKILDLSLSSLPENQFKAFRKIVMDYLSRCFKPYGSKLGPNEKGGAGLGIYMSFNAVNKFIINVDPHIRTELIGIIDLNLSVKEFKYLNKSFHFFTKNTLARQFCLHNPMRDDF